MSLNKQIRVVVDWNRIHFEKEKYVTFRVYQDIEHYLAEREVDKIRVLYWYHRQFEEVAEDRYLADLP